MLVSVKLGALTEDTRPSCPNSVLPSYCDVTKTYSHGAGQDPVYYMMMTDSTHIAKVPMKKRLSHNKTKMERSEYLIRKALDHVEITGKRLVAARGTACEVTHNNVPHLRGTQEETDTKI